MRFKYKLWALVAGASLLGVFAGLILPPIWIVIIEGLLILFIAFCWLCS